jgi:hypothetical protein
MLQSTSSILLFCVESFCWFLSIDSKLVLKPQFLKRPWSGAQNYNHIMLCCSIYLSWKSFSRAPKSSPILFVCCIKRLPSIVPRKHMMLLIVEYPEFVPNVVMHLGRRSLNLYMMLIHLHIRCSRTIMASPLQLLSFWLFYSFFLLILFLWLLWGCSGSRRHWWLMMLSLNNYTALEAFVGFPKSGIRIIS